MEKTENLLKQLLERGDCPCDNSIIYANGEIDYIGFSNGKPSTLSKSSIDDYFASEPEAWFETTCSCETDLYRICGGEGSSGTDGIVYVIDKHTNDPLWFLFLDFINPIERIEVEGGVIKAYNNNRGFLLVSITDPIINLKFIKNSDRKEENPDNQYDK